MIPPIRLFIEDKEVEFSKNPEILYNYKVTDTTNPTAVKNSYSKSITIQGTNQNNAIFGHIWNLERIQSASSTFNPLKKANFTLYLNSEIYEKGYCKLDSVTTKNNTLEYSISLYGGLGSFFYGLSYDETDTVSGDVKKSLADLSYVTDEHSTTDIEFRINKTTVNNAWAHLTTGSEEDSIFDLINFVPAYNGKPSDFSNNKALIYAPYHSDIFTTEHTEEGTTYTPYNGWMLGECTDEMTEWETFDLRSYMQRPAIRMKRIIEACCRPENNGGYKVELDPHFFHSKNPYWENAWLTLPLLKDLSLKNDKSEVITSAHIERRKSDAKLNDVIYGAGTLSSINNLRMRVKPAFSPINGATGDDTLYSAWNYECTQSLDASMDDNLIKTYAASGGLAMQLWALDKDGKCVASSDSYILCTNKYTAYAFDNFKPSGNLLSDFFYKSNDNSDLSQANKFTAIEGYWSKMSGSSKYEFLDNEGNAIEIGFSFNEDSEYDSIVLKAKYIWTDDYYFYKNGYGHNTDDNKINELKLYTPRSSSDNQDKTIDNVDSGHFVKGTMSFDITEFEVTATDYTSFLSNSLVTKEKLLATDNTPCDYLLNYCKLFGLYIYKDPCEEADDLIKYPNGVIRIMDRDTFYKATVVDIKGLIDRSKTLKITPQTAGSKWYTFGLNQNSEANDEYNSTYGYDYGLKRINTGYNFDSNTNKLYESSIYKGGIMVREKDKYFAKFHNSIPVYAYNGLTYSLYTMGEDGYDSYEIEFPVKRLSKTDINTLNLTGYDSFSKLQLHKKDNSPADGDGILVFLDGANEVKDSEGNNVNYYLTDDVEAMVVLNDSEPCWIMGSAPDSIPINKFPNFSRNIVSGQQEGIITHSWDFANSKVNFVPNLYNSEGMAIYDRCWADYIADMYSVDSRKLTAYVLLENRPSIEWLRDFYWFDNAIWRLNEIKDWKVGGNEAVQCEFIKVIDMNAYNLKKIGMTGEMAITLQSKTVNAQGGAITGNVYMQDGGEWSFGKLTATKEDGTVTEYSPSVYGNYITPISGSGVNTEFEFTVPQNNNAFNITWRLYLSDELIERYGEDVFATLTQNGVPYIGLQFMVDSKTVNLPYNAASSISLNYVAKNIVSYSVETDNTDMIQNLSVDSSKNRVLFDITENGTEFRTATVTLTGTGQRIRPDMPAPTVSAVATINQYGTDISVSITEVNFDYSGEQSKNFNIVSNSDWTITTQDE